MIHTLPPSRRFPLRVEYAGRVIGFSRHAVLRMEQRSVDTHRVVASLAHLDPEDHRGIHGPVRTRWAVARRSPTGWSVITVFSPLPPDLEHP